MAIYEIKLNRYSPHVKRYIPDELAEKVNQVALNYVLEQCKLFDNQSRIVDDTIYTNVSSHLVITMTSNFRTNLLERNEQEFLSKRLDY